ncbi:MAG TPA: tetratricopeptide repeat protein [Pyrinomonadaceae bacterium]|nr:tetratricopeptide repeat protein [Pyrinomonadaceae bacterium]
MKNLLFVILFISAFVQFGIAQKRTDQVGNLLKQGEAYLNEFEFEKAVAACDEALEKFKAARPRPSAKQASIYYLYGRIYEKALYLDKAVAAYTMALKFDAGNAEYYQSRAYIYWYIGVDEKGDADFEMAETLIRNRKKSRTIETERVLTLSSSGSKNSLIEYPETFQTISFKNIAGEEDTIVFADLDKDGNMSQEEIRKGYISHLLKLNKLVEFNPESDLALWKRGDFYLQLDEMSNQVFWLSTDIDFLNALDINPRYEYLVNRGVVRARRDNKTNYEYAVKLFTDAIQINDKSVEAFYNRGLSYLKQNENEKAIADFTEIIKLDARFVLAYKSRAKAFRAIGKNAEAEADETMLKRLGGK